MDVRLILDSASGGAWNMALDEALLQSAAENGVATLRFYSWAEPTLSLGYFQKLQDRHRHPPSRENACVRRSTGGGAILHDCDLTYSFTTPLASREAARATEFYDVFHRTLAEELAVWRIETLLCHRDVVVEAEPFLCFQRRAAGDVLLGGSKIAGSAQRRRRGALLQHGSLLLKRSPSAPELSGIADKTQTLPPPDILIENWSARIAHSLKINLQKREATEPERRLAKSLQAEKYANPQWTKKR